MATTAPFCRACRKLGGESASTFYVIVDVVTRRPASAATQGKLPGGITRQFLAGRIALGFW